MTRIETIDVPTNSSASFAARIHRHWQSRPHTFWLDSACDPGRLGRFSFLGTDPYGTIRARGTETHCTIGGKTDVWHGDPLAALAQVTGPIFSRPFPADFPAPFVGGLVGYLAYDVGHHIASLPLLAQPDLPLPDLAFGLYDAVVCIDHLTGQVYLVSSGLPLTGREADALAAERLAWLRSEVEEALAEPQAPPPDFERVPLHWRNQQAEPLSRLKSTFTREAYLKTVEQVLASINSGVVEQVNLAQRFSSPTHLTGPELYHRLRAVSPAPYAGLLRVDDAWILSSSPERFLLIRGDHIETRPIKGTRPRGKDAATDAQNRAALLSSTKDEAEHRMIVEVERAELERVCIPGTVTVPELMVCEQYETVFHLVSTVSGKLAPDTNRMECIRTLFPGGSITGRPKVRSMELINELEPVRRGVYTGAIGYLGIGGNVDLNVAIRTLILSDGQAHFHVGGAIVAQSQPEDEYEETLDKAEGMVRALLAPNA